MSQRDSGVGALISLIFFLMFWSQIKIWIISIHCSNTVPFVLFFFFPFPFLVYHYLLGLLDYFQYCWNLELEWVNKANRKQLKGYYQDTQLGDNLDFRELGPLFLKKHDFVLLGEWKLSKILYIISFFMKVILFGWLLLFHLAKVTMRSLCGFV